MADLKALSDEMAKLKKQLETVLYISSYRDYDDLSGLDDYKQIKTADQRQQLEEYRNILYKLDEVQSDLAYFDKPIREVSRIYTNESDRYETGKGHYYTSGSGIEFLRVEKVYNYDMDEWENAEIWTCSRVESKDGQYYIVGYPDVEMSGLTVRVRGKRMKIISVSNVKGGVGKTTTAAVLAAGLTAKGYKVLMIDSDPQTNLTMCFMSEPQDGTPSLYHVYAEGKTLDEVKTTIKLNLDLVIGDFELCNADMQFIKAGRLKMLRKAFKGLKTIYDFVIIDTPPNLGILSLNAFLVSDYIIVPMAADSFSLKGVRLLKQTLDEVEEETEKDISVIGLLLTKYTDRTNVARLLEKSVNSAAKLLNTKVFDSRIRQATVLQESQIAKIDLLEYAPKAPVTADYQAFIDELLKRIEV